jgi:hypothetical protein
MLSHSKSLLPQEGKKKHTHTHLQNSCKHLEGAGRVTQKEKEKKRREILVKLCPIQKAEAPRTVRISIPPKSVKTTDRK